MSKITKSIVYYFTGTGNSLTFATHLAQGLKSEFTSIAALEEPLDGYDTVGVVFPSFIVAL